MVSSTTVVELCTRRFIKSPSTLQESSLKTKNMQHFPCGRAQILSTPSLSHLGWQVETQGYSEHGSQYFSVITGSVIQ